jgi:hypothetical protein
MSNIVEELCLCCRVTVTQRTDGMPKTVADECVYILGVLLKHALTEMVLDELCNVVGAEIHHRAMRCCCSTAPGALAADHEHVRALVLTSTTCFDVNR